MKVGKKSTKPSISREKVSVDPPKGYHWMKHDGQFYLMKGDYAPHEGAVEKAKFQIMTKHSG
jgi:hypothetical protein